MLVLFTKGDDAVTRTAIVPRRVLLHQVANVDDEASLNHGDGNPVLGGRVPDLQAFGAGLLQKNGDGAEISVCGDWFAC